MPTGLDWDLSDVTGNVPRLRKNGFIQQGDQYFAPWCMDYPYTYQRACELQYPPPNPPQWLQKLMPGIPPDHQIIIKDDEGDVHWRSSPGPQTWTQLCPYDEVLIGGRRGGGKSSALIAWMSQGDFTLAEDDPAQLSYLNDPSFRGLILRYEYQSMGEFVDECEDFFRPFGVKAYDDPVIFDFKSGARIYTNHLGNKNAYEKYRGQGITKIAIEELTQIPKEGWYLKLLGSLRNKKQFRKHGNKFYPKLRTQILSTTNPDGTGAHWVKKRFVHVLDANGKRIEPNVPMRDPVSKLVRVFIPMTRVDNPYLRDDKQYEGQLMAQDEVTRRQWMEGDWDAAGGLFFQDFRPEGPLGAIEKEQFPWARHIIESADLKPWFFRWGSLDWGYNHPASSHKWCKNDSDKRIHCYDELSVRRADSYELGALLARWWLPELESLPDHSLTIVVSPDMFKKTDDASTPAERMAAGIKEVLGPYGALLMRYSNEERALMAQDPEKAKYAFEQRRSRFFENSRMGIVLKPANDNVDNGCDWMRQLLRFRPVIAESEKEIRARLQATFDKYGLEAYERELRAARVQVKSLDEVLPRMLIWSVCKELDRCLRSAVTDETNPMRYAKFDAIDGVDGDDALDDARYGAMAFKEVDVIMPKQYFVNERMENAKAEYRSNFGQELDDPSRLRMIALTQAANYEKVNKTTPTRLSFPRAGSTRHRMGQRPN